MHHNDPNVFLYDESARQMTICNACRYCEGHCAVFPAMERRLDFDPKTIDYLANLCHQCGACYQHCQYADPHEFNVNVPKIFSEVRLESYAHYTWPHGMAWAYRNGGWFSVISTVVATLLLLLGAIYEGVDLFRAPVLNFYDVFPHGTMASLFGAVGIMVLLVWFFSVRNFWLTTSLPGLLQVSAATYGRALVSALTLKNLGGGHGKGCYQHGEVASHSRRLFHHLTMYGFIFCFIATCLGTFYHYVLDEPAPYGWFSGPKLFGVTGGLALLAGCAGLWWSNVRMEPANKTSDHGLGASLIGLLFFTSLSGLALPLLKGTTLLAPMLCLHLGLILALFLNFAWGKFIHGLFRLVALIANEYEQDQGH